MVDSTTDTDKGTSGLSHQSLRASGIAYLIGDLSIFIAHALEGDKKGMWAGPIWASGALACARYGNPKAEQQLKLLTHRLGKYLKEQGVEIPKDPTLAGLTREGGVIDHVESFLYKYPAQILNVGYATGAGLLIKGGHTEGKKDDIYCGLLIGAGALAGLLIPEKTPDPAHPAHGAIGKAWEWIQEKPLRVSSTLFHINNLFLIKGAFPEKGTPLQKNHLFRFLTAASYIFGNVMLSLSSKNNVGDGDVQKNTQVTEALANTAARVVAAQPPELREALVQQVAGYLASQPEVKPTAAEIASAMHEKMMQFSSPSPATQPDGRWQQHLAAQTPAAPTLTV